MSRPAAADGAACGVAGPAYSGGMRGAGRPGPEGKWRRLLPLALCLSLATPAGAADDPPSAVCPGFVAPKEVPAALVADLLAWIGGNSGYGIPPAELPPLEVSFCLPGSVVPYEGAELLVQPDLRGVYDLQAGRIYLVLPWSATSPRDVSVLLHELIHHVQFASRSWPCPQAAEWEAYRLQAQWLEAQELEPGFDWFQIWRLSRCPGSVHP